MRGDNSWKIDGEIDGRLMGNSGNMERKWMEKRMGSGWNTDVKLMEHGWTRAGKTLTILYFLKSENLKILKS